MSLYTWTAADEITRDEHKMQDWNTDAKWDYFYLHIQPKHHREFIRNWLTTIFGIDAFSEPPVSRPDKERTAPPAPKRSKTVSGRSNPVSSELESRAESVDLEGDDEIEIVIPPVKIRAKVIEVLDLSEDEECFAGCDEDSDTTASDFTDSAGSLVDFIVDAITDCLTCESDACVPAYCEYCGKKF